jgi:hypothetical protein
LARAGLREKRIEPGAFALLLVSCACGPSRFPFAGFAVCCEALAAQWPALAGATLGGRVLVSGEGDWRDGQLSGRALVRLSEGRVDVPAKKLALEGLELAVPIDDLAARRTAPAQVFTLQSGHYDVVTFGAGRVVFALDGDKVQVAEAVFEALGGRLRLEPFAVSLTQSDVTVAARAEEIDVTLLLALLPPILAEASKPGVWLQNEKGE